MGDAEGQRESAPRATLELARSDIGFSAAHFSVVDGRSERLHGHNYTVTLRAHGHVRGDGSVVDFAVLKRLLRAACAELDERMLVPADAEHLQISSEGSDVVVRHMSLRYVFPAGDVRLLPIVNTTCECLADHLLDVIRAGLGDLPVRLDIRVEESPGQGATVSE